MPTATIVVTRFPTANADPGPGVGWINPDNARADDGVNASVSIGNGSGDTDYSSFGFDAAIPSGAPINAVKVIAKHNEGSDVSASCDSRPIVGGVNQTLRVYPTRTVMTVDTNDHTADRAWTRGDLLDANFKVHMHGAVNSFAELLDYIKVEVTYSLPPYESGLF